MKISVTTVLAVLFLAWLAIRFSDVQVLVHEVTVRPGQRYVLEGHGDIGNSAETTRVCSYFNGREIVVSFFRYAPGDRLAADKCPYFLHGPAT
ncbi:MAG: hypothetical protein LJE84_05090 [Gammaproteobacteria bacterium]|nr:hypothetical protein [Gammaproteobacteria bacterium]